MPRTDTLVLIGNGLPVAVNRDMSLARLTELLVEEHADDLEDIRRLLSADVDPAEDFEVVVAGLETAEEALSAFMRLADRARDESIQRAAGLLRENGILEIARRLYFSYCSVVLRAIMDRLPGRFDDDVNGFVASLAGLIEESDQVCIFTLNYDVLLEHILISEERLNLRGSLTDFFSGLGERQVTANLPVIGSVSGPLYFPQDPPARKIHLHHLHGSLCHFSLGYGLEGVGYPEGTIFKLPADVVRGWRIYERLAALEDLRIAPVVVLGSRKEQKAAAYPFVNAYNSLEADGQDARRVLIVGYSFRDVPVNEKLRRIAESSRRQSWLVVDHRPAPLEAEEYEAFVRDLLGIDDDRLRFQFGGVGQFELGYR